MEACVDTRSGGLSDKATFEQRPEHSQGTSHPHTWEKKILGKRNKFKSPEMRTAQRRGGWGRVREGREEGGEIREMEEMSYAVNQEETCRLWQNTGLYSKMGTHWRI